MAGLDQGEAVTGAYGKDEPKDREVAAKALKCPSCGAPYTLRGFANTRSYVCQYCGSILDTTTPEWQIVDKVERKRQTQPIWPLGQRGKFDGKTFELVGWMERYVLVDGRRYSWEEHLFFNPFYGYRYLVHQDGHFQLVEPLPGFPSLGKVGSTLPATYEQQTFRHFTTGVAQVSDVIGEFPWRVGKNDRATCYDYIDPPAMLSCEVADRDVVWARGRYLTQDAVWDAVTTPKRPVVRPRGVYPNQPNPWDEHRWLGKATVAALALWFLFTIVYLGRCANKPVLKGVVRPKVAAAPSPAAPSPAATPASATPEKPLAADPAHNVFEVVLDSSRDPATLECEIAADVNNAWAECECALIDTAHDKVYSFAVGVSYYSGYEDGESWSEGSKTESVVLGQIPNGRYLLQVERSDDAAADVSLVLKRDVPMARYPCVSFILIIAFPLVVGFLRSRFESRRWAESDHAPSS